MGVEWSMAMGHRGIIFEFRFRGRDGSRQSLSRAVDGEYSDVIDEGGRLVSIRSRSNAIHFRFDFWLAKAINRKSNV